MLADTMTAVPGPAVEDAGSVLATLLPTFSSSHFVGSVARQESWQDG